jgi:hypothetical protein
MPNSVQVSTSKAVLAMAAGIFGDEVNLKETCNSEILYGHSITFGKLNCISYCTETDVARIQKKRLGV